MGKSIVSCSWLMATTRLVSACPSCAPRLASCPRSPSCSTAVSQRTSSTETTCGRSAWMRSSRPPRKPSCMTLSCRSLRYRGHFVCDVLWWEAEQVRLKWGLLCLCSEDRSATGAGSDGKQKCKSRQIQAATRGHVNNVGREAGIYTQPGVDEGQLWLMCEWGAGVQVPQLTTRCPFHKSSRFSRFFYRLQDQSSLLNSWKLSENALFILLFVVYSYSLMGKGA